MHDATLWFFAQSNIDTQNNRRAFGGVGGRVTMYVGWLGA